MNGIAPIHQAFSTTHHPLPIAQERQPVLAGLLGHVHRGIRARQQGIGGVVLQVVRQPDAGAQVEAAGDPGVGLAGGVENVAADLLGVVQRVRGC